MRVANIFNYTCVEKKKKKRDNQSDKWWSKSRQRREKNIKKRIVNIAEEIK